jgi:MFS family permease
VATAIGSLGLAAGGIGGVLLGARLTGSDAAAGLPLGLVVVGTAVAALLVSAGTDRLGRCRSLALGYLFGALGAALVIVAAVAGNLAAFLAGSTVLGAANAALFLTRYAAAEVAGRSGRGAALGAVLFATALGAIASPGLLGPSGDLVQRLGLPSLTGLYVVALLAFGLAALLLALAASSGLPWFGSISRPAWRRPTSESPSLSCW